MNELVSVAVVAYNAADNIEKTLDSIARQSYENIELIVSDDASTDLTVEIAGKWIERNRERFSNCQMLVAKSNQGTTYNVQKAVYSATGSWVKLMAADDFLRADAIKTYMEHLQEGIYVYEANMIRINGNGLFLDNSYLDKWRILRLAQYDDAAQQFKEWVKRDVKLSPTIFFNVDKYKEIGGSDHFEPLIDDWTLVLKFLRNGYKVGYVDQYTVIYKKHESLSHSKSSFLNQKHVMRARNVKREKCYPNISKSAVGYWLGEKALILSENIVFKLFHNKKNIVSIAVYAFGAVFNYMNWLKLFVKILNIRERRQAQCLWLSEKEYYGY